MLNSRSSSMLPLVSRGLSWKRRRQIWAVERIRTSKSSWTTSRANRKSSSERWLNAKVANEALFRRWKCPEETSSLGHVDVLESQLNTDDFERVIDSRTGQEVLRLKKGAAARKGLTDLLDVQFEMVTGADGKQSIVVKGGGSQGNTGKPSLPLASIARCDPSALYRCKVMRSSNWLPMHRVAPQLKWRKNEHRHVTSFSPPTLPSAIRCCCFVRSRSRSDGKAD